MKKVAVILSGCGYLDGSEITETVISLLELDKNGAKVQCFAPDKKQFHVINHISTKEDNNDRNILEEAARIARGDIKALTELNPENFDALLIPGGYGMAKNLSDFAVKGVNFSVDKNLSDILSDFLIKKKPIGAICISPLIVVASLKDKVTKKIKVTIGNDPDNFIEQIGGINIKCNADEYVVDEENMIISSPAYMQDDPLSKISEGIAKTVKTLIENS